MPNVTVAKTIRGASVESVWKIARHITDYPQFMDQVVSVSEEPIEGVGYATSWVVLFNGNELRWIEADRFDDDAHVMTFEQIEGDLATWNGQFGATAAGDEVVAEYRVTFDLGVPALADLLHPLGERAIRDNCMQMLDEIERRSQVGS